MDAAERIVPRATVSPLSPAVQTPGVRFEDMLYEPDAVRAELGNIPNPIATAEPSSPEAWQTSQHELWTQGVSTLLGTICP